MPQDGETEADPCDWDVRSEKTGSFDPTEASGFVNWDPAKGIAPVTDFHMTCTECNKYVDCNKMGRLGSIAPRLMSNLRLLGILNAQGDLVAFRFQMIM